MTMEPPAAAESQTARGLQTASLRRLDRLGAVIHHYGTSSNNSSG